MPRVRDPARDKAREIWEASGKAIKLCKIAEQLHVPEATVRAWKSKDGWDQKNQQNVPKNKRSVPNDGRNAPKRKRGAQPGHPPQGGAKPGNINAVTHGAYMRIYDDLLTDEERGILETLIEQTERDRLLSLYAQHQITERRLMRHINDITLGADRISHRTAGRAEPLGGKNTDRRELTKDVLISQEQEARRDQLRNFTDALTRLRGEMRRTAESLMKTQNTLSQRDAAEIEIANRRLDLEFLRLEAQHPATTEESCSNFDEALRETADNVWAGYDAQISEGPSNDE